jgi:hypothetical protein
MAGSGEAGSGEAGSGEAGSGEAGSGEAGSGTAGSGEAGSGTAGSGEAGSGTAGSSEAGSGTAGSGEAGSGTAGSSEAGSGTPPAATFADVYAIFTDAGCADCHGGASPPQGLNLETIDTAYANLVGIAARECTTGRLRVASGDPAASYLINKLTGVDMCSGQRMPRGGPFLDDATIDVVRSWIQAGATR